MVDGGPAAKEHERELAEKLASESRRGVLVALPFLVPTLYLLHCIVGATSTPRVTRAFVLEGFLLVMRVAFVALVSKRLPVRGFQTSVLETASALSLSVGLSCVVLAPETLSEAQILELTLVTTAIASLALQGMAARLWTYLAYVAIPFVALAYTVARAPAGASLARLPIMIAVFGLALSAIAVRAHRALRKRLLLGIELREAGLRDALTGLRNRRFASEFAAEAIVRNGPLAFLLVDLDHFKRVNDVHGHAAGDDVLVAFGNRAREIVRGEDVVARWGGEEFLVIMPVRDAASGSAAAERLRAAIASRPVVLSNGDSLSVTCSIGVSISSTEEGHANWQAVVERADKALYRAKAAGRNRVVCDWVHEEPALRIAS